MDYYDLETRGLMFSGCQNFCGVPYHWGETDCFSVLNGVYEYSNLNTMDRSVVLDILDGDVHASKTQIDAITDALTIESSAYSDGSILILTSNDVSYGTGLLINGHVLLSCFPKVKFVKRSALKRVCRIEKCCIPKVHLNE